MANNETYRELKLKLDEVLAWFDQDDIDIDEALARYKDAEALIAKIERYLEQTQEKIQKLKV